MISMIADVGERQNCLPLESSGLLDLKAVLLIGRVVEFAACSNNRRRSKSWERSRAC